MDWDEWRARYDEMSFADHVAFYDTVWQGWPEQRHFTAPAAKAFFDYVSVREPRIRVLEVGGWRGEMAREVMRYGIRRWDNHEICRGAAEHPVAPEPYRGVTDDDWVWTLPFRDFEPYNVFVASHVIEHMKYRDLYRLVARLAHVNYVYLEAPLEEEATDWTGYQGSHILDAGWRLVLELFRFAGFEVIPDLSTSTVKCLTRSSVAQ